MKTKFVGALAGIILLGAIIYFLGDLVANNASFFNRPGAWKRMSVYVSLHAAWTSPDYPLPEVSPRKYMGEPSRVREDILGGIAHFPAWRIESDSGPSENKPETLLVRVPGNFWRASERLALTLIPDKYGVTVRARSDSDSHHADFGANRNTILRLFHAIDNQIAIHPPA
jgi:hypothetical protein